ncbi:MAG: permease, partial [Armatimonadetes bacterium]|nr:permease [Armatimonadota bacterium]
HMVFRIKRVEAELASCACSEDNLGPNRNQHSHYQHSSECEVGNHIGILHKVCSAIRHAADDFLSTGSHLIFGAFIAAGMQTFISQDALVRLGHGPIVGTLVMMTIAFVISLCAVADAFVAAAFVQFPIAARMAFMVMGPMVDIKLLAMYSGFLSRKATTFVFGLAAACAFAYAMFLRHIGV